MVGGGAYEMAITDCTTNEVGLPMSTVAESSARWGSRTENADQHSRRTHRRNVTGQKLLGGPRNVSGNKTRGPRARNQMPPDESAGRALSKQLVKSSTKRGRRRSININAVPPQGMKICFHCTGYCFS